jgi:phosphinothricin acetyltransferase
MEPDVILRDLDRTASAGVLAILNDAILTSTALWDYAARPLSAMDPWFAAKDAGRFPVIGAVDRHDALLGFATYGTFRGWPAYKYSIEHSVYVHRDHRRKGLGLRLLTAVIERAQQQEFHTLIAGIEASNEASRKLHRRLGFEHCGTVRHAGYKFGRWLDLEFHQRILTTPAFPVEG